jgi:hypothetical protein
VGAGCQQLQLEQGMEALMVYCLEQRVRWWVFARQLGGAAGHCGEGLCPFAVGTVCLGACCL